MGVLETIREYGGEQLQAHAEAEAARRRHAAWYLAVAEEAALALAGPDAASWLARLDDEHDNLRSALGWAQEQGDGLTALRLAGALGRYWAQRGHLSEGRRWCATALTLPAAAGADTPPVRLQCLVAAGRLAIGQAAYGEAEPVVGEAVALAREHGGPAELAAVLNTQGLLARAQNRYAASAQAYQAALPLARSAGHRGEEATALLGLAYAAMFTGDAARAGALTEESLAAARTSQDRLILAQALFFLGWGASNTGAYERARALVTEALGLFAELGEDGEHAEALFVLGTIAIFTGDYRGAVGIFEQSLAERRDRGDEHTAARHLGGLGTALLNAGDLPRCRAVLEESLEVARQYDDQWSSAMSLMLLGQLRLAEADPDRAQAELTEAAALFASTGNMVYLTWCLEGLAGVAAAGQDFDRAAEIAGGRDALRTQTGVLLPPVHPAAYERMLKVVRAGLGEAGFTAAHARLAHRAPPEIIAAVTGERVIASLWLIGITLDDLPLGGDGDPRIGPEAGRELIERVVGPVRLVVGQQDPPGTGPAAQAHRVVRRRVAERGLGGNLVRPQERVVDQHVHARGQGECAGMVLTPPLGARPQRGGAVIGNVGDRRMPVADPVPEGPAALVRDLPRLHREALGLEHARRQRAERPFAPQAAWRYREVRRGHPPGQHAPPHLHPPPVRAAAA